MSSLTGGRIGFGASWQSSTDATLEEDRDALDVGLGAAVLLGDLLGLVGDLLGRLLRGRGGLGFLLVLGRGRADEADGGDEGEEPGGDQCAGTHRRHLSRR